VTVPSASRDAEASNDAVRSAVPDVNDAVGFWLGGGAAMVTVAVRVAVAPPSSVTVSVTG
jgi:hypothetical protein